MVHVHNDVFSRKSMQRFQANTGYNLQPRKQSPVALNWTNAIRGLPALGSTAKKAQRDVSENILGEK